MHTFEDLIAQLRAGTPPSEALPHLRRLFTTLPSPKPQSPTPHIPTSRLFHTLPDDIHVQIPYLRPPFNAWDALESPEPHPQLFDSELEFDVYKPMHFRFLQPPTEEVMRMLTEWDGGFEKADMGVEVVDVRIGSGAKQRQETHKDIERATVLLRGFFGGVEECVPCFCEMDSRDWAVAFSRMGATNALTCGRVLKLLCGVHQPGLAEFVLFTVVPFLITGDDQGELMELLSVAVEKAEVCNMEMEKVKGLLQLYRDLEIGVLGAVAQLTIVKGITNT